MERESGRTQGLIHSSYPLDREAASGVVSVILSMKDVLAEDYNIRLVGPHMKDKSKNAADYTFGRVVRKIMHDNTDHELVVSFNKGRARNLMLTIKPDFVILEEPFNLNAAHTLISGMPKRKDGKPLPIVIGHFHAQREQIGSEAKALKFATKFLRRPTLEKSSIQNLRFFTKGYKNTIVSALDGRMAVSQATAEFWMRQVPALGEFEIIHNPVDTESFTPEGPKIESWNDGKTTILFTGRHDPRKGIPYLARTYDSLRKKGVEDIKLKIAGDGVMTEEVKALVEKEKMPDVKFLGRLPKDDPNATVDLVRAKRSADICVYPTLDGEGFGLDPAEAASSGTLVVASDINGYREVLGGRPYARMPPPRNIDEIARAIMELKNLPREEKERLSLMAREDIVSRFSKEVVGAKLTNSIEKCLSARGKPDRESWPWKARVIFSRKR